MLMKGGQPVDMHRMSFRGDPPGSRFDPPLRSYRLGRRFVAGVLVAVWIVAAIVIAFVPRPGIIVVVIAFGLANTAFSMLLMRQMRVSYERRSASSD